MGNSSASIGVIGGSGLYHMPELTDVEEISVYTPFGPPSDSITLGTVDARVTEAPVEVDGEKDDAVTMVEYTCEVSGPFNLAPGA